MSTPEDRLWNRLWAELDELRRRLDRKIQKEQFNEYKEDIEERFERIEHDLDQLKKAALTPDQVTNMIGDGLKQSEARGITTRDRWMRYGLALLSLGTFIILIVNRVTGHG